MLLDRRALVEGRPKLFYTLEYGVSSDVGAGKSEAARASLLEAIENDKRKLETEWWAGAKTDLESLLSSDIPMLEKASFMYRGNELYTAFGHEEEGQEFRLRQIDALESHVTGAAAIEHETEVLLVLAHLEQLAGEYDDALQHYQRLKQLGVESNYFSPKGHGYCYLCSAAGSSRETIDEAIQRARASIEGKEFVAESERLDRISRALSKYYRDKGVLPATLTELVGSYVEDTGTITDPLTGRPYDYESEGNGAGLGTVEGATFSFYVHMSRDGGYSTHKAKRRPEEE